MSKFYALIVIGSLLGSSAGAQGSTCRTDDPNCRGYATFGPAAVERCISLLGRTPTEFCQLVGESQRVLVNPGDRYCAVSGRDRVPELCGAHSITVTERR